MSEDLVSTRNETIPSGSEGPGNCSAGLDGARGEGEASDTPTITITISREAAEDLVADERYIKERTMVELEYAALAALGRDE